MSQVKKDLTKLPKELKQTISEKYGSLDRFYATVYLIARNEHQAQMNNVPAAQQRLNTIKAYQGMIRFMLDEGGANGQTILDDIASDYLEDFVQFKEQDFGLTNEDFIAIIKRI
ncbi:hypothetical protein [Bacteroides sp.]|uniref:hypothetical protein n=1 Tax=Bacteroides sp. TaxID=29523 RepID=UPI0025843E38|nr:hypothetical protein [Bacteroides sp.]